MKSVVVHPRMDFMLYSIDPIVNQAAKWRYMFGGKANASVTIRSIINRGGEQGAQHSQALHAWFAHIPGLRVVMPSSVADARDLLIASVLCNDPVIYIDDRWLYEEEEELAPPITLSLENIKPSVRMPGNDITIVGCGYSVKLALMAAALSTSHGISCEVIDLRILNPFDAKDIVQSVCKTGRLLVVDGGWRTCGISAEIVASTAEYIEHRQWKTQPRRITLPDAPAPTSSSLEQGYYPKVDDIVSTVRLMVHGVELL